MFDFTDDEKEKLRSEFDREHPNIPEDQRETEFKAYLAKKLRAKLDAEKNNQDNNEVLDADELLPEVKEDNGWKEEVKKAVKQANAFFNEKSPEFQEFTETPNPERPDHLFFKDAKNNTIAFASKEQAYVEGEQAAFDELVVSAQKMGKNKINFGKFEQHPEYKVRLYLACLKHGMEMKNAPELEELKQYPEEYKKFVHLIVRDEKIQQDIKNASENDNYKKLVENLLTKQEAAAGKAEDSEENKAAKKAHTELLRNESYKKIMWYRHLVEEDVELNSSAEQKRKRNEALSKYIEKDTTKDEGEQNRQTKINQQLLRDTQHTR